MDKHIDTKNKEKMTKTTNEFIPVHQYAKENGTSVQNVYRWIRERKIKPEDVKVAEVVVKRIRIKRIK